MSIVKRLAEHDQTVVVVQEDGYVALLAFFADTRAEDFNHPDEVILLGADGAIRLATALTDAAERVRQAA